MEKKNTILLTVIAIATLLVAVVGATFAYFTATVTDERNGQGGNGSTNVTTGQLAGTTTVANVEGAAGSFTASDVYPGHKEVAALQVSATSAQAGAKSNFKISYDVTANDIGANNVTVSLYKSETRIATGEDYFECKKDQGTTAEGDKTFFETCNDNTPGTLVETKTLAGGAETIDFANQTIITDAANTAKTVYYYVVVEFVDTKAPQNADMGKTLTGTITVEPVA